MPPTMMIETAIAPTEAPSSPCAQKAGICWKNAAHMQKMPATRISVYIAGDSASLFDSGAFVLGSSNRSRSFLGATLFGIFPSLGSVEEAEHS